MIPTGWQFALLTLAVFRIYRLVAIDDLPPLPEWRNRAVGASQKSGEWMFRRPTLAKMIGCPFCLGFWVAVAVWACWLAEPHWTLVAATPWALSALVGITANYLDRDG